MAGASLLYPFRGILENTYRSLGLSNDQSSSKKYILINVIEAPARWMFDTILKPTNAHGFVQGKLIPTHFKKTGSAPFDFEYDYGFHEVNGYQFPYMWQFDIPTADGKTTPLSNLAENMFIVRGCDMVLDGHEINNRRLEAPSIGSHSISGLHDANTSPLFGCLSLEGAREAGTAAQAYSSPSTNRTIIKDSTENYIEYLLRPFIERASVNSTIVDKAISEALTSNKDSHIGKKLNSNEQSKKRAANIINQHHQVITREYNDNVKKYQDLINRSIQRTNILGLTDKRVPGLKFPLELKKKFHQSGKAFEKVDYLGAYKEIDYLVLADDVRTMFDTAEIKGLAKQMALAEVSLKYDLTSSININVDCLRNMKTKTTKLEHISMTHEGDVVHFKLKSSDVVENLGLRHNADSHKCGSLTSLLCDTLFWRAMASCTYELTRSLKVASTELWNNSLIHLTTEFEREPGDIDKGSHHGFTGHTSTFLSGAVKKTEVIGNIYTLSHDPTDVSPGCGTWGKAADVKSLGNRKMVYGNISSSISNFLGCETPLPHEKKVFKLKNGKITSLIEAPENKEFMEKNLKTEKAV